MFTLPTLWIAKPELDLRVLMVASRTLRNSWVLTVMMNLGGSWQQKSFRTLSGRVRRMTRICLSQMSMHL